MTIGAANFFEAIVRNAADAIIYADQNGVIRLWNRGAERIFGYTEGEATGQTLDIIIPERLRARHWEGYRSVMKSGESRYGEGQVLAVPGIRKDGQRISLEFSILTMKDEAGRMQGMTAIMRDVTARFEELRALRKQLAASHDSV
ncbi:PAS domain S-box protein [bacterium]|nr:MAG: PAS domain S-box protein [bacterium]